MKKKYFNCNHVIALDPIRIWTHYAPQNDRLNLSFVKDFHVVGKKMARNGHKWPFMSHKFSFIFLTKLKKTGSKKNVLHHSF